LKFIGALQHRNTPAIWQDHDIEVRNEFSIGVDVCRDGTTPQMRRRNPGVTESGPCWPSQNDWSAARR